MDDEPSAPSEYPAARPKPSATPSWVLLGFIVGALFVWLLPRETAPPAPPVLARRPGPAATDRTIVTAITSIEAVFEAWGKFAVWDNELTEVALWNSATRSFSELYEVKRSGGALYFRSIPRLTRPLLRHGKPPPDECPLQFTETEQQYREWREHGRTERRVELAPAAAGDHDSAAPGLPAPRLQPRAPTVTDLTRLDDGRPARIAPPPVAPVDKPAIEVPARK